MDAAVSQTSYHSFSFEHKWTLKGLKNLVYSWIDSGGRRYSSDKTEVSSKEFYPGFKLKGDRASFKFNLLACPLKKQFVNHPCLNGATRQTKDQCCCMKLSIRLTYEPKVDLFAEGYIALMVPGSCSTDGQSSQLLKQAKKYTFGDTHSEWITKLELTTHISEDELIAGSSEVTYDDSLTAFFSVTVHVVQELKHFTETIQSIPQITPSTALIDDRKAKVYTDVVIKCKDKTFDVHRVIIASQSPFFKLKLERWETDDRSIDMFDLDPQIVEAIIKFMYAEKIPNISTLAPDLLAASEQYQLSALKNLCEKTLMKKLTDSSAPSLLKLAISHNAQDLQAKVLEYINLHLVTAKMAEAMLSTQ